MSKSAERIRHDAADDSTCFAESDIQRFYAGKTVFLTGSTGYMGKCLVEKLLRGCPGVKRIYLLVREKRGKTPEERIDKFFDDTLFDTLREMGIDFKAKIRMVEGDLMRDDMALSKNDKDTMIEEVNIIFHSASNVKFMERMSKALKINVMGTFAMINLAKQCKHVEGFMYVSTTYSHCYKRHIMEEAYPSPADMKMVQDLIAADSSTPTGLNDAVLSDIRDKYPNTYCFTKAIAEGLVDDAGKQLPFPCIIYRPSVVLSSWKEPVRGWCGNVNGPALLIMGYGLGVLHATMMSNNVMDFVPVDMSVNSMLASMWDAVKNRPSVSGALVYNYGSSIEKPMSIKRLLKTVYSPDDTCPTPSIYAMWRPFIIYTKSIWYFWIIHIFLHLLPALMVDTYLRLNGKKPRALSDCKKLISSHSVVKYFILGEWMIDISEMNKAIDRMSSIDYQLFFCDIRQLDWRDYCSGYWTGLRLYILKDPISTLPAAQRKARIIETVHCTVKYSIILLLAYFTLRLILRSIGNF